MTHEYYPTSDNRLLEHAANADPFNDFETAHQTFNALLHAADTDTLQLPDDEQLEQKVRDAWAQYECILEAERAMGVLESVDPRHSIENYDLLERYKKFLATDRFLLEQCSAPTLGEPHLLMIGSGPLPISSYIFGKSERGFGYRVTNVDTSVEALNVGKNILDHVGLEQTFEHASGAEVEIDPTVSAVIVAALAGSNKAEKLDIIKNISTQLQPGARMSVRYGTGVRRLFYPECILTDTECEEYGLRRVGGFEPPRDYMNAIGVYEKC